MPDKFLTALRRLHRRRGSSTSEPVPSRSREHGNPDISEELLKAEAEAMATPIGVESAYDLILRLAIFECQFAETGEPRSVQDFRRRLITKAKRFEEGMGWRGENRELAKMVACNLRHVAAKELPQRPRGRQSATNSAVPLLDAAIDSVKRNLIARGHPDLAATLLNPGQEPEPGEWGGKGGNLSIVVSVLRIFNQRHGSPFSEEQILNALENIRRRERRRQKNS